MRTLAFAAAAFVMTASTPGFAETTFGAVHRESGVINLNGVPHPYMIEGESDEAPCLFVGPGTQYFQLMSDRLKQSIRFIYVDFERTWNAPAGADVSSITLQNLVDEVEAVRVALDLDTMCLIGHSTPAFVAVEYALQHPERTSRLILIGAPAYYNSDAQRIQREFWQNDASPERKARYAANVAAMPNSVLETLSPFDDFSLRYTRADPYYFYDYNYDFTWANIGHHFSTELAIQFYRVTMIDYDPRDRLADNRIPIFSALGRYNYIMPPQLWDGFAERVPNTTIVMFNRSGHFPMIEEQRRFDTELLRWMGRTPDHRAAGAQ